MQEEIRFPDGEAGGWGKALVMSPAQGTGLGVVLLAPAWNISPHIRAVGGRLVDEGFTALVPDLSASRDDLAKAARSLSPTVDLLGAYGTVRGDEVGVLGFGAGGALALWLATLQPQRVRAVVPFYGLPPAGREPDWTQLAASVEGHFAGRDDTVSPETVDALETRLAELGKEVRMFTYPGTRHGFFDDTLVEVYDTDAAHLAWVRTLELLRAKLG